VCAEGWAHHIFFAKNDIFFSNRKPKYSTKMVYTGSAQENMVPTFDTIFSNRVYTAIKCYHDDPTSAKKHARGPSVFERSTADYLEVDYLEVAAHTPVHAAFCRCPSAASSKLVTQVPHPSPLAVHSQSGALEARSRTPRNHRGPSLPRPIRTQERTPAPRAAVYLRSARRRSFPTA
jgi:hypothetical protein